MSAYVSEIGYTMRTYKDTVRLLPVQRHRRTNCAGEIVVASGLWADGGAAWWGVGEVVTMAGLIIYDGYEACRAGTEAVLGGGISDTASPHRSDFGRAAVGAALHLVLDSSSIISKCSGRFILDSLRTE